MRQNYFVHNGEKYYTGTVIIIKYLGEPVEASFVYYDADRLKYFYKIKSCVWSVSSQMFQDILVAVTDKRDETINMPVSRTLKDGEIDGLTAGWVWYILLMAISTIFNDAALLWVLISVVFFNWRKSKIEKEGTYIEW